MLHLFGCQWTMSCSMLSTCSESYVTYLHIKPCSNLPISYSCKTPSSSAFRSNYQPLRLTQTFIIMFCGMLGVLLRQWSRSLRWWVVYCIGRDWQNTACEVLVEGPKGKCIRVMVIIGVVLVCAFVLVFPRVSLALCYVSSHDLCKCGMYIGWKKL